MMASTGQSQVGECDPITADELSRIFNKALRSDDSKPSREGYEQLARDITQLRLGGWPYALQEEQDRRYRDVHSASEELLFVINRWAELEPEGDMGHPFGELAQLLAGMGTVARERAWKPATRGRRREPWHRYGHELAKLIAETLKNAGYGRALSKVKEDSVTAVICADLTSLIFNLTVQPSGFASAMRNRSRRGGARARATDGSILGAFPALARFRKPDDRQER